MPTYSNPFDTRIARAITEAEQRGVATKYDQLQAASNQKIRALDAGIAQAKQRELANKNSIVGQLDLDPDGVLGQATNLGASFVSGASRVAGDLASLVGADFETMVRMGALSEEDMQAVGRFRNGEATQEDIARINSRTAEDRYSPLEQADLADKSRARGERIDKAFDLSGLVQQDRRAQLSDDLGKDFESAWGQTKQGAGALAKGNLLSGAGDLASGVARLIFNAGEAAVSNPGAAAEYISENVPQLLLGAGGKAGQAAQLASNLGYASENYQKGIAEYQAQNGGAYPDQAVRVKMAAQAASLALAEQVGDLALLKGAKPVADATQSFKQSLKAAVGGTAKTVGTEAATEGYQTFTEGEVTGKEASAFDVYQGAVIGGLVGGGMSAPGQVASVAANAAATQIQKTQEAVAAAEADKRVVTDAIESGDVSALLKAGTKNYSPAKAIDALAGNSALETATEEKKAANREQAGEILADLEYAFKDLTPEGIQENQQKAAAYRAAGNEAFAAEFDKAVADAALVSPKDRANREAQVIAARDALARFTADESIDTQIDVKSTVEQVNAGTATPAAAQSLINLSMSVPERLSDVDALAMANNTANGLTTEQRDYLRSFSAARIAENALKEANQVSKDIFQGNKEQGHLGLVNYRQNVTAALLAGSQKQADRQLSLLERFQKSHEPKAAVVAQALKAVAANPDKPLQVIFANGQWQINQGKPLTEKERAANGGLNIHKGTPSSLATAIKREAKAISNVLAELQAARNLKFTTTKAQTNVKDIPQSPDSSQGQSQVPETQAAPSADQATPEGAAGIAQPVAEGSGLDLVSSQLISGEPNSSTETTENSEAQPLTESSEKTSAKAEGSLTGLQEKAAEGTPSHQRNLLAEGLTQSTNGNRPLVMVKDFLTSLVNKSTSAKDYLGNVVLTPEQEKAIATFQEFAEAQMGRIGRGLNKVKATQFRHDDVLQYLMQGAVGAKGDVDENIKTAIAFAAFAHAADSAGDPVWLKKKEINSILGRSEDAVITKLMTDRLGKAGLYQHLLVDSLGQKAMDALGIKENSEAAKNMAPRLRVALGTHALYVLENAGLITRTTVSGYDMKKMRQHGMSAKTIAKLEAKNPTDVDKPHYFYAIARDGKGALMSEVRQIAEATKGTKDIVGKLFKSESRVVAPSLEPVTSLPKTLANSAMAIPAELKKILLKAQARPRVVREDTVNLMEQFSDEQRLSLFGGEDAETTPMHLVNSRGAQAKNEALKREWENFVGFVGDLATEAEGLKTKFYFPYSPWKNQRVGIASTVVNPQSSKIHRFLVTSPEWKVTIDPTNTALMDSFWLRVGEGLGVKTERAQNQDSIDLVQKKLQDPVFVAGIDALIKNMVNKQTLTTEEAQAVVAAVAKGGENMHSLDALIGVAYQQAKFIDGVQQPFTVEMMGEVDGVANGTMLNHVLLGAKGSVDGLQKFANMGGFFEEGSAYEHYNEYRSDKAAGNLDVYETTARQVYQRLQAMFDPKDPLVQGIWAVTGEIFIPSTDTVTSKGRNLVKDALNPLGFGSGIKNMVEGMAEVFITNIYGGFEKLAQSNASQAELDAYVKALNYLINSEGDQLPVGYPISYYLQQELSYGAEMELRQAFNDTIGEATRQVVEGEFASFLSRRDQLNAGARMAYGIYSSIFGGERTALVNRLTEEGKLAVDKNGALIADLSQAQEDSLNIPQPIVATAMSGKNKNVGWLAADTDVSQNKSPLYVNETGFSVALGNGKKSAHIGAMTREISGPGVVAGSALTHSFDSGIAHRTQEELDTLNVHDAAGAGVAGLVDAARLMNQNTWKGLVSYSPLEEVYNTLAGQAIALAARVAKGDLSPEALASVKKFLTQEAKNMEVKPSEVLRVAVGKAKKAAYDADKTKFSFLATLTSIDQYAFNGGAYKVTEQDRAEAVSKLNAVTEAISPRVEEALASLDGIMSAKVGAIKTAVVAQTKEEVVGDQSAAKEAAEEDFNLADGPWNDAPVETAFGMVGTAAVKSDAALVKALNTPMAAKEVVRLLASKMRDGSGRMSDFNLKLLQVLNKTVTPDLQVIMVKADTAESSVLAKANQPSHAWYVAKDGKEAIYVLSPEFADSGLTAETLLHELVHGALAQVVANPTGEAVELVNTLDALREQAKAYVAKNQLKGFDAALADTQEFIAWGMSNQAFQRSVLGKISFAYKAEGNSLVNGMKAFISNLVGLLFKGTSKTEQEVAENGMTALITNVSGLFAASNQAKADLNLSMAAPAPMTYSTLDIHSALDNGSHSSEFDDKLRGLLSGIVHKLHGPFGSFKESLMANQTLTAQDVWAKALATGAAPFASGLATAPMSISEQERFAMEQVEAVVREVIDHPEASTAFAYKELVSLFVEARSKLKPTDFSNAATYDFVFDITAQGGKSAYLSRFAAFALAHEEFNGMLNQMTGAAPASLKGKSIGDKAQIIFQKILAFFSEKVTRTYRSDAPDVRLNSLVTSLINIEAKRKAQLSREHTLSAMEAASTKAFGKVKDVAMKGLKSQAVRANKSAIVRAAGSIGGLWIEGKIDQYLDTIIDFRDKTFKERHGVGMALLGEIKGPGKMLNLLTLLSVNGQRMRKQIQTRTSKFAREAFANAGNNLDKATKAAITQVFMKTGMHVLMDRFDMTATEKLLSDPKELNKAIKDTEQELAKWGKFKDHFIHQANALAYFRMTGEVRVPRLMMNAGNISKLFGTNQAGKLTEAQSKAAEVHINQLVALYALEYADAGVKAKAADVLRTENQRSDEGHGVQFLLTMQKRLETEAKDRIFKGQEALMMHGYTSDIVNPNINVVVANEAEGDELVKMGYKLVGPAPKDKADPDQSPRSLYVVQDGGLMSYRSGITSLTNKRAAGTTVHSGYLNVNTADGLKNASDNADIAYAKPNGLASGPRPDLNKAKETHMAPVVNPQGEIVNWRYMMHDKTRAVLQPNYDFDQLIGVQASSIFDKQSSTEVNKTAFEALHEQWTTEKNTKSASYVLVGPNSMNADGTPAEDLQQIWAMLPEDTRNIARGLWGRDGMYVRQDQLTPVFGYRKYSLAEALRKDPAARSKMEQLYADVIRNGFMLYRQLSKPGTSQADAEEYAKCAVTYVARGEKVWQDIMKEIKDIIVVKSIVVALGNISSNFSLLLAQGIPLMEIIRGHTVAMRGAQAYMHDTEELDRLQTLIANGMGGSKLRFYESEIARLQDAVNRNPIKEMVDSGLMATIAEDTGEEDEYSYKSALIRKVEGVTSKLPEGVVNAAKVAYMSQDSKPYQVLSRLTQLSDFSARYVMYQNLLNRKENPLSKDDAVHEASEAFINYDIPLPKYLQYTDDMGITMFSKYALRIQRVLVRTAVERPGRVLMMILLNHFVDLGPIVLDSSWTQKIGNNPLNWGALQAPGALSELASVNAALQLIK